MDVKARTCERDAGERVEREIKRDREQDRRSGRRESEIERKEKGRKR